MLVVGTMTVVGMHQLSDPAATLGIPRMFTWHLPVPGMGPAAVQDYLSARNILRSGLNLQYLQPLDSVI